MNKLFLLAISILVLTIIQLFTSNLLAQAPQAFKYQSIVRNNSGSPMESVEISIRASVREGSASGITLYQETHAVTTNQFGLINLEIGNGVSQGVDFSTIVWGIGSKWMEIEADFGKGFVSMGTSQLLSVPFALNFVPGPAGTNGTNGIDGNDGLNGLAGTNGSNGVDGNDGLNGLPGTNGTNGVDGNDGLIGLSGTNGLNGLDGNDGLNGLAGTNGTNGTNGVDGATGSISQFAMFYGLTSGTGNGGATDYATTIPAKTGSGTGRVPFPKDGPSAGIARINTTSFTLPSIGTYEIVYSIHTTESGQLQLELNDVDLPETVVANMNSTAGGHLISGNVFITTSIPNSILAIINPSGNATSLTITPSDGASTHSNTQILTIKKIF
jgi:hypothetical protein